MISIIICSRKNTIPNDLSLNIEKTIGREYELIVIDNAENQYSIFEAYNLGIERSKGEYLCFIHDDILFHTQGWGNIVNEIFKLDENIGLIGVAGSEVKTKMPSGWWNCPDNLKHINIIQHISIEKIENWLYGLKNVVVQEVAVIDGVFMVMRKSKIRFNTKLKGFHNYDLNLSLETLKAGKKVVVTKDILIEHFSNGVIDISWYVSTLKFHRIYNSFLPVVVFENIKKLKELQKTEIDNGLQFIDAFLNYQFNFKILIYIVLIFRDSSSMFKVKMFKKIIKLYIPNKILKK